jgi:hypothetical protein
MSYFQQQNKKLFPMTRIADKHKGRVRYGQGRREAPGKDTVDVYL